MLRKFANILLSSAYTTTQTFRPIIKLLVFKRINTGPSLEPYGTLLVTSGGSREKLQRWQTCINFKNIPKYKRAEDGALRGERGESCQTCNIKEFSIEIYVWTSPSLTTLQIICAADKKKTHILLLSHLLPTPLSGDTRLICYKWIRLSWTHK